MAAFDTYADLEAFFCGKPVLNKLGLIVKTRNGVTKARMILDSKESGVKWITAKTQRVILPRLFVAVLRMLFLLSLITSVAESVSAFVLDFSDAFWQIPIHAEERRLFGPTAVLKGKREFLVLLRTAQGSANSHKSESYQQMKKMWH